MAELQTISAAFEAAGLVWSACVFLKKVSNAGDIAQKAHDRLLRLKEVLDGIHTVLEQRRQKGRFPRETADVQTNGRIYGCIRASEDIVKQVEKKLGGFEQAAGTPNIIERVRLVLRHPTITRLQIDLEAGINALNTELSLLHVLDQAHTQATIGSNHEELLQTLAQLREQVNQGNQFLKLMHAEKPRPFISASNSPQLRDEQPNVAGVEEGESHVQAIESLANCLQIAENLHERYTSEYAPDNLSIRAKRIASREDPDPPFAIGTPISEPDTAPLETASSLMTMAPPTHDQDEAEDSDEDVWPLEILSNHIQAYLERAEKELDQGHFNQAELALQSAIRDSIRRERKYSVVFQDRVRLQEEVATCYQRQGKFSEAIAKVHSLLREGQDEVTQARQNQLLATIYYDRHVQQPGRALGNATNDIEHAERHAKRAFNRRYALLEQPDPPAQELENQPVCIALLIRILEARDKTVEANEFTKLLYDASSSTSGSIRRISTMPSTSGLVVEDKQANLIDAICAGDFDLIQRLLNEGDIDVDRLTRQGLTPLMCAVERSDENTVHKLLDPVIGADVNNANKRGITALHHAAERGLHEMVRCLLDHDAEVEMKDKRGETAFIKAVQSDEATVVKTLFDGSADPYTKNHDEWSALHFAVRSTKTNMIDLLLDLAPELNHAVDRAGKTALHYCCELDLVASAEALLSHANRLDVNAVDIVSRSPLYFAASKPPLEKRQNLVRLLLQHGAVFDHAKPPLRCAEYPPLKPFLKPRKSSVVSRHDSVSTDGSIVTTSSSVSRWSRIISGRMQHG